MSRPGSVALALGSGGARGYAHIGAIEVLHERGHEILAIAGSSMGALVGGVEAAGGLADFSAWARSLNRRDVLRLIDLTFTGPGVVKAERLLSKVNELVGDVLIEDLPIAFTAVATDLGNSREVWLQKGPLNTAIRASIAIPSVITPIMVNGRLLADGGLLNPIPIEPITAAQADLTIAVSLMGERQVARSLVTRFDTAPETGASADQDAEPLPAKLRAHEVVTMAIDAAEALITRYRLAGHPPDVLITVPTDAYSSMDFHRAAELIELGRTLTIEALDNHTR